MASPVLIAQCITNRLQLGFCHRTACHRDILHIPVTVIIGKIQIRCLFPQGSWGACVQALCPAQRPHHVLPVKQLTGMLQMDSGVLFSISILSLRSATLNETKARIAPNLFIHNTEGLLCCQQQMDSQASSDSGTLTKDQELPERAVCSANSSATRNRWASP